MADLKLDILVVPTYSVKTMMIYDISYYPDDFIIQSPTLDINIPGFDEISIPFVPGESNIINSAILELTNPDEPTVPIPDGVYTLKYSVTPSYENYVSKNIMRVDQLQEKFDKAFMKLDMSCGNSIKKQDMAELDTIYYFIQGSIAAANMCNIEVANKLYAQAAKSLDQFNKKDCNCSGTNYLTNF